MIILYIKKTLTNIITGGIMEQIIYFGCGFIFGLLTSYLYHRFLISKIMDELNILRSLSLSFLKEMEKKLIKIDEKIENK